MEMTFRLCWIFVFFITFFGGPSDSQYLELEPYKGSGICKGYYCNTLNSLQRLKDCVVVMGNLHILLLEKTKRENFQNMSFPNLREVTGFLLVYRVRGLDSLGRLFPNLARIRGNEVLGNFGLIVHDMQNLVEVGLYSLVKIDRGGVVIWGSPLACNVDTVDWKTIAPQSRHVLNAPAAAAACGRSCRCGAQVSNYCWNDKMCQRFLSGPFAAACHEQCLGCRAGAPASCSACRRRTHHERCLADCPPDTLLLHENEYCVSSAVCEQLGGWAWRGACVTRCPAGHVASAANRTCELCDHCGQTCNSLTITTLDSMQAAEPCVYVNGSLVIYVRAVLEAMEEMTRYLNRIQVVTDYVAIFGSHTITSLDFLSSLKRISGRKLKDGRYSLVVHGMTNMTSLFSATVTKNLIIENGTLNFYDNPALCMSHIINITQRFPVKPNDIDVPQGMNGYRGSCKDVSTGLQVTIKNNTTATVQFLTISNPGAHHTVLFAKIPPDVHIAQVPESCSQSEWSTLIVNKSDGGLATVQLHNLKPSSRYALCVETYNPSQRNLARSDVVYFDTPVGKPAPPFIRELLAISEDTVYIRWSDHVDYRSHIKNYKLEVNLIEIDSKNIAARNYCSSYEVDVGESTRHGSVSRAPAQYAACEAPCPRRVIEPGDAWFDHDISIDCDEYDLQDNSTHEYYKPTVIHNNLNPKIDYFIRGLAPYRDYRIKLRACTKELCSRSTQGVVRTLRSNEADIVSNLSAAVCESKTLIVTWQPPQTYNGAILAYFVEVKIKKVENELGHPVPRSWCVSSNSHSIKINIEDSYEYLVSVCTSTLATQKACSGWVRAGGGGGGGGWPWWCAGIIIGMVIWMLSVFISRYWKRPTDCNDEVPLIDSTSMYRSTTEPPDITASDFDPMYL